MNKKISVFKKKVEMGPPGSLPTGGSLGLPRNVLLAHTHMSHRQLSISPDSDSLVNKCFIQVFDYSLYFH